MSTKATHGVEPSGPEGGLAGAADPKLDQRPAPSLSTKPLYETKAGLFKALAHPSRLAALEVLAADPEYSAPVTRLLEATGADPSAFSQHMAVLKRRGVVESTRSGNAVEYRLTEPLIAELLVVARAFLVASLAAEHPDAEAMVALHTLPTIPGATAQAILDEALEQASARLG